MSGIANKGIAYICHAHHAIPDWGYNSEHICGKSFKAHSHFLYESESTSTEMSPGIVMRYTSNRPQYPTVCNGPGCLQSCQMPHCGGRYCSYGGSGSVSWARLVFCYLRDLAHDVCSFSVGLAPAGHGMETQESGGSIRSGCRLTRSK